MSDEFDPFKGESGLKDDYDGLVVDAWFELDTNNPGNRTNAWLKIAADDGEEVSQRYGLGSDWASYDGGETIEHPAGAGKAFNNQTAYQALIKAGMASGAEEEMRRRSKELYGGRGPMNAKFWVGLKFHWEVETETRKIKDRETGEMRDVEINRTLPTKFLGISSAGAVPTASAPVAASTGSPGPVSEASENSAELLNALAPEDSAKVRVLAMSQPYHEWVDSVLQLPGVATNGSLVQALGREDGLYRTLKEG